MQKTKDEIVQNNEMIGGTIYHMTLDNRTQLVSLFFKELAWEIFPNFWINPFCQVRSQKK